MMHLYTPLLFFVLLNIIKIVSPHNDFFEEELMLKPLSSNHVYAYFQFTTVWEAPKESKICEFEDLIKYFY